MKIVEIDFNKNVRYVFNGLMEEFGQQPLYYFRGQFRNIITGEVRLITKKVSNKKNYSGNRLMKYLEEEFYRFVAEKELDHEYNYIPYSKAEYDFPNCKGKALTFRAKIFYSQSEKENNEFFLRLAREKAEEEIKKLIGEKSNVHSI